VTFPRRPVRNREPRVAAPDPDEIYARTQEEGRRRLSRPLLELCSTAFVAGADVVLGIIALGTASALVTPRFGPGLGHLAGSLAFGICFVFIVVGRSELFTENFLVPIAGLEGGDRRTYLKLGELWAVSPIFNIAGGMVLILIATTQGVLPDGTGEAITTVARHQDANDVLAAFMSAVVAGGVITLMTWLVEGSAETLGTRIVLAWMIGAFLALAELNHVIVVTLEMIMGQRYGAGVGWGDTATNFGVAFAGNMVGGLLLVTASRFSQARGAASTA
jgi:formate/nitrite transporter FocA (FNT family)